MSLPQNVINNIAPVLNAVAAVRDYYRGKICPDCVGDLLKKYEHMEKHVRIVEFK